MITFFYFLEQEENDKKVPVINAQYALKQRAQSIDHRFKFRLKIKQPS
jgi:hypothetical protein